MNLVEIHTISKSNINWKSCDNLSFLSKNLYNQALYLFNKEYKENKKFIRYNQMDKILKKLPDEFNNYNLLTSSVSQPTMMLFDKNVKSFLSLINLWKKDKTKLNGCPKFMKYKDKEKGRNIAIIRGDICVCKFRNGYIHFPKKLNLQPIKTINVKCQEDLVQVRIVPKSSCYNLEIVYKKIEMLNNNIGKASIDLGINNLATLTMESGKSIIYNGKNIKSINKYYNKLKAKKQSKLIICQGKFSSKKLNNLTNKRNNKIKDQLHKISKDVVNELEINKIKYLAIGYNKEWKNGINLGKKTNQAFVSIPYIRFIDMITYKCKLRGINVVLNEESYTSKCSSLDLEKIKKQEVYLGNRVKRGLFRSKNGIFINADVNGSINIGRKVFTDEFLGDIGLVLNPLKKNLF